MTQTLQRTELLRKEIKKRYIQMFKLVLEPYGYDMGRGDDKCYVYILLDL